MADELEGLILNRVGERPISSGYERVTVPGFQGREVSEVVHRLFKAGLLQAAFIEHGFGHGQDEWCPSILTDAGRRIVEGKQKR